MERNSLHKPVNLVGIAGWKFVPAEPRHNTFHSALATKSDSDEINVRYLGLKNTFPADWILQVLPDTVLKRIPYISPLDYIRIKRGLDLDTSRRTVLYVFEGSLSWLLLLKLVTRMIPNSVLVCNLFPSSKYSNLFFRSDRETYVLKFLSWIIKNTNNLFITFDTKLMIEKVNSSFSKGQKTNIFPLPSALPYLLEKRLRNNGHYRVLVNIRDFEISKLHELLQSSCPQCTFVLPRGTLASEPLSNEFGKYANLSFDLANIPVEDYLQYIDQFDYMIFLYSPSINSSGRLLDAIVRRIPVCLPRESTEWCDIAREWGELHDYGWSNRTEQSQNFNHPLFESPTNEGVPIFTPTGSRNELSKFAELWRSSKIGSGLVFRFVSIALILGHWLTAAFLNYFLAITSRVTTTRLKLK